MTTENSLQQRQSRAGEQRERDDVAAVEREGEEEEEEEEEYEFEFKFVGGELHSFPLRDADEIFYNGRIRPSYDIFHGHSAPQPHGFIQNHEGDDAESKKSTKRMSLKKLFSEERASSSSEADELDGLAPETYCVWTPRALEASETQTKKNESTYIGCSKRWKFKDR